MSANATALLGDVRVVEIGHHLTEHAGRILAAFGAEVWLVEPPTGAWTRVRRPRMPGAEDSARGSLAFLARNTNKRSLAVDLDDGDDVALFRALVERADVVITAEAEAYHEVVMSAPGDAARIIITDRLGLGRSPLVGFAAGGGLSSTGWPHQPPCGPPSYLTHDGVGIYAATMAMSAVWLRRTHGARADYEVAYEEAATASTTPWTRLFESTGTHVAGQGAISERQADGPYPIIEAADGWVRCVFATPRQWDAVVELLGAPDELTAGPWGDRQFRRSNTDLTSAVLSTYSKSKTVEELFHRGQALGLTVTPVNSPHQFRVDPHVVERRLFVDVDDSEFRHL